MGVIFAVWASITYLSALTLALTCQTYPFKPDSQLDALFAHSILPIDFLFVPDFGQRNASIAAQLAVAQGLSCLLPNVTNVNTYALLPEVENDKSEIVDVRQLSYSEMKGIDSAYRNVVKDVGICDALMEGVTIAFENFDRKFWKINVKHFILIRPSGSTPIFCQTELIEWAMEKGFAPSGIFVHIVTIEAENHLVTGITDIANVSVDSRFFPGHWFALSSNNFRTLAPMTKYSLRAFAHVIGLSSQSFARKFDALLQHHDLVRFDETVFVEQTEHIKYAKLHQLKTILLRFFALGLLSTAAVLTMCCLSVLAQSCCHVFREIHELQLLDTQTQVDHLTTMMTRTPISPGCTRIPTPSEVRLLNETFGPRNDDHFLNTDVTQQTSNLSIQTI